MRVRSCARQANERNVRAAIGRELRAPVPSVPDVLASTQTAPGGLVVVVDGWLEGIAVAFSCGPAPLPGPPVPEPFSCHVTPMLTAEPVKPVTRFANGYSITWPPGSVPVQGGAYAQFAPNPASDGTNNEPRRALYLLRMVIHDAVNCRACRGWLVVGRLDASASPSTTPWPPAGVEVRSGAEIAALLESDRSNWLGRVVFVDGHVVPGRAQGDCQPGAECPIGILEGTDESVVATACTAALLLPDTDYPTDGLMAMIVRDEALEYLGWMGFNNDTVVFAIADLLDTAHMARGPETVVAPAWIIDSGSPLRCGPVHPPTPPPDTPFETCPFAWLTSTAVQPVIVTYLANQ